MFHIHNRTYFWLYCQMLGRLAEFDDDFRQMTDTLPVKDLP